MDDSSDAQGAGAKSPRRRRWRIVLITCGVLFSGWALLYILTEDIGLAPFIYAIF